MGLLPWPSRRWVGLTERESELLHHLVGGSDTRELAQRLYMSEYTVQDHLKSIFAKTGANSRRVLIARDRCGIEDVQRHDSGWVRLSANCASMGP